MKISEQKKDNKNTQNTKSNIKSGKSNVKNNRKSKVNNLDKYKFVSFENQKFLSVEKLNIYHLNKKIIRNMSFEIGHGEIVGFVGGSEMEKSTLAKSMVHDLDKNYSINSKVYKFIFKRREKEIDIYKNTKKNKKTIRGHKIAFITKDTWESLDSNSVIYKHILRTIKIYNPKIKKVDRNIIIHKFLDFVDIDDSQKNIILNKYFEDLNSLQKMKIILVITLLMNPRAIVLNSFNKRLDTYTLSVLGSILKRINAKTEKTIILFSNDIKLISQIVKNMYIIFGGKVIEKGTVKEIISMPAHPYTWKLISLSTSSNISMDIDDSVRTISESDDNISGDPYARYNDYALKIDFRKEPLLTHINGTHYAATWLLDKSAPKVVLKDDVKEGIEILMSKIGDFDE